MQGRLDVEAERNARRDPSARAWSQESLESGEVHFLDDDEQDLLDGGDGENRSVDEKNMARTRLYEIQLETLKLKADLENVSMVVCHHSSADVERLFSRYAQCIDDRTLHVSLADKVKATLMTALAEWICGCLRYSLEKQIAFVIFLSRSVLKKRKKSHRWHMKRSIRRDRSSRKQHTRRLEATEIPAP
eukprot:scaffold4148_cov240-Pinguiococcus_pyrenoidosus.AAC.2